MYTPQKHTTPGLQEILDLSQPALLHHHMVQENKQNGEKYRQISKAKAERKYTKGNCITQNSTQKQNH